MAEGPTVYCPSVEGDRLHQGEVLGAVWERRVSLHPETGEPELEEVEHPYAVVSTQDCDLEQDAGAPAQGRAVSVPCAGRGYHGCISDRIPSTTIALSCRPRRPCVAPVESK